MSDPFDALIEAERGWHYSERGAVVTPGAIAAARPIHAALVAWLPDAPLVPAVDGGLFIEAIHDSRDVLIAISADGTSAHVHAQGQGARIYSPGDPLLISDIEASLRRSRG